jgi:hypothetical protein
MMTKTCPSCGYQEPDMQALYCNKCGYPFPQNQPKRVVATAPTGRPAPRAAKRPVLKRSGGGDFLSFGTLITEDHLKLIYILGAGMIILLSVMGVAGMFTKTTAGGVNVSITNTTAIATNPTGSPLFWIGFLIVGSILWRMFCEIFAMLSRGYSFHHQGDEDDPEYETEEYPGMMTVAAQGSAGSEQMVECPKCHKIVAIEDVRECEHCGVQGCSSCIRMMGLLKKTMTCRECFEAK